jgi:pimeloyl-[acyl-carrier protein] methyl ester esterase
MAGLHVDHYEYAGSGNSGAPLLLIHGWAMHGGMWGNAAEQLAQHFRVMAVDLPGHGYSVNSERDDGRGARGKGQNPASTLNPETPPSALDAVVDELSAQFDGPLAVCGWSLGGQVALRWAMRHPGQVSRLVTVASTPSFVRRTGWDHALSVEILQEFADDLQHHYALTLRRFLALQMRGSEQEREWLAVLRDALFSRGEPDPAALQSGLDILRGCDLCGALAEIDQPVLVLAGERDALIPVQAAQYMAGRIPSGRLAVIDGAGHAPFLSHPGEFARHVIDFLNEE